MEQSTGASKRHLEEEDQEEKVVSQPLPGNDTNRKRRADIVEESDTEMTGEPNNTVDESSKVTEGIDFNSSLREGVQLNNTRLIITHLELENFKSYGGVRKIGPFHKNFSAVVGPNGSGKSNVLDALLFAFGKRASKIRLNKVSELIHKSDRYPDLDFARVTVFFEEIRDLDDQRENFAPIEGTKFSVSRIAYKNNSSKYLINETTSSFTEVTEMLLKKDIDLNNNRFLILQGEVEQISLMKPKATTPHEVGFLEYLEDIIGTNKYVESINASAEQIVQLNEFFQEKMNRLKAVEKERGFLEKAKSEAVDYMKTVYQKNKLTCVMHQFQHREVEKKKEKLALEFSEISSSLDSIKIELKDVTDNLGNLSSSYDKIRSESDVLRKEAELSEKKWNDLDKELIKKKEELKFNKNSLKKFSSKIEKEKAQILEHAHLMENLVKGIPNLENAIQKVKVDLNHAEAERDKIFEMVRIKTEPLRLKLEEKQKELFPFSEKINERKQELVLIESQLKILREKKEEVNKKLSSAKEEINSIEQDILKKESESKEQKDLQNRLAQSITKKKNSLDNLKQQLLSDEADLQRNRVKLADVKSSLEQETSKNRVVAELMKFKKKMNVTGIYGKLGDLGVIDPKYDVAISTSCPGLHNIVVDNVATGQKCVEYLREKKLGTATFIMLDKMVEQFAQSLKRAFEAPANSCRLFDLIKPRESSFLSAFYFVTRDTLVTMSMENAMDIAFKNKHLKTKVVTLEGDMIDPSGVMSGGGNKKLRGAMQTGSEAKLTSDLSESEVSDLEATVSNLIDSIKRMRKDVESLHNDLSKEEGLLSDAKSKTAKLDAQIASMNEQKRLLSDRIAKLQLSSTDTKEIEREERSLDGKRMKAVSLVEAAETEALHIQNEIQSLDKKIMASGGSELKKASQIVQDLTDEMNRLQSSITKSNVDIENSKKQISKLEASILKGTFELEKAELQIETLENYLSALQKDADELYNAKEASKLEAKNKLDELEEVKEAHDELKNQHVKLQTQEIELKSKAEDIERVLQDFSHRLKNYEFKMNQAMQSIREVEDELGDELAISIEDAQMDEQRTVRFELLPSEDLDVLAIDDLKYEMAMLEEAISKMDPNMSAIAEYRKKNEEYRDRQKDLDDLNVEREKVRGDHDALRKRRLDEFMNGFSVITMKLKEMYQMLTLGGDAELELVDSLDPFAEGIVFSVRPPKKSWKNISNLSGGEKTLSSLALVFSLHYYKPTPLYVMDEIDAALDFKNVSIVANYIKERTQNAQFIIISLRNNMFELGDRLVGIYKTSNISNSITINPRKIHVQANQKDTPADTFKGGETMTA